jgi:drug/metabolite transporter (DMT)-like permease
MPPLALTLILAAALVHVVPHAAIKGARDRDAFVWWMLAVNAVVYSFLLFVRELPSTANLWMLIGASAAIETLYLFAISRAYASGALSVVYPLARGSAPLFLLGFSLLVLHERLTVAGACGVVAIAAGVYLINLPSFAEWRAPLLALRLPSPRWALSAGFMTAVYTSIDKLAIRFVDPLLYIYLVLAATLLFYTPLALRTTGWSAMRETFATAPMRVVIAGIGMPLAYGLVLLAMRMGVPASYAGSVREVSVIVAAIVGIAAFGERVTLPRLAGACVIAGGIVAVAWRG